MNPASDLPAMFPAETSQEGHSGRTIESQSRILASKPSPLRSRRYSFIVLFAIIVLSALAVRVVHLDLKPLHNDEAVNYSFTRGLYPVEKAESIPGRLALGSYRYDSRNYHGPFLYYATLPSVVLWGFSEFALRILPALFGTILLLFLLPLQTHLGSVGVVASGLLLALSPGLVYFSRYFIHETFFVFFSLAFIVSAIRFYETNLDGWLLFAFCSAAFVFTIKETSIIVYFSAGVALGMTALIRYYRHRSPDSSPCNVSETFQRLIRKAMTLEAGLLLTTGCMMAAIIVLTLYSSFLTNIPGIWDSLRSLEVWTRRGIAEPGHAKEFWYFFKLLAFYEWPILLFGLIGSVISLRRESPWPMTLISLYGVTTLLVYSLISYKTPWCLINVLVPLAVTGGYGVSALLANMRTRTWKTLTIAGCLVMVAPMAFSMIRLNFTEYDNDAWHYVYGHASRDVVRLAHRIEELSALSPAGKNILICVTEPEQWPLVYYLRDFRNAQWGGRLIDSPDAPLIVASSEQEDEIDRRLKHTYVKERFLIRRGVSAVLYSQTSAPGPDIGKTLISPVDIGRMTLSEGLFAQMYSSVFPSGSPASEGVQFPLQFTCLREDHKPVQAPFSLIWSGYVKIEKPGRYTFATRSDDGSCIFLGDRLLVDNGGEHAIRKERAEIELSCGYYPFKVTYFDIGGAATLEVLWSPPGGLENPIPKEVLAHEPKAGGL